MGSGCLIIRPILTSRAIVSSFAGSNSNTIPSTILRNTWSLEIDYSLSPPPSGSLKAVLCLRAPFLSLDFVFSLTVLLEDSRCEPEVLPPLLNMAFLLLSFNPLEDGLPLPF